jgi:hypothetical protein
LTIYHGYQKYMKKITSKSSAQRLQPKWSLVDPLLKLCVTPSFSINFRSQIETKWAITNSWKPLVLILICWCFKCVQYLLNMLSTLIQIYMQSNHMLNTSCFVNIS